MNKNLYRIVFNKARGLLMVVPDIAGSGRAGTSSPSARPRPALRQITGKLHRLCFALLLAQGAVQPVQAGIVADGHAPGSQQPTIINTANGTPQVNIQTPGAGGVSRNVYRQFDVDSKGVVLNNSHASTQTQIAGMVNGNPWLARGEAKIILNEVNARDPSQLNGFIEVAGRKAQVVIANPAGITCDGCGFINANRATLTTGQVLMEKGQLTGYDVNRGEIVIQGYGLDSSRQDSTDLISRAVKVNAGIWAKALNVTTGRNQVDAAHQRIDKKTDDGSLRPLLAVDVSQLGGMYAQKIRLLGTESGVGVHNAGALGAAAGDVVINADGTLTNSGSINASQNVQLASSATLMNQGTVYAAGRTDITSQASLSNTGIIAAGADTRIVAAGIHSGKKSVLAAGIAGDGTLGSSGELTLTSHGELQASGQNIAAGKLTASATSLDIAGSQTYGDSLLLQASEGDILTTDARLSATHQLTASTRGTLNNDGGTLAAGQLHLTANRLSNRKGTVQQTGTGDLQLVHAGGIDNREGNLATNSRNLTLTSGTLDNQQGTILHAGDGQLMITTGRTDGEHGKIISNGALSLSGSVLGLDNALTRAAGITLSTDALSHHSGRMIQSGNGLMRLEITGRFDNQHGEVFSKGALSLTAAALDNRQGQLIATSDTTLQLLPGGELNNRAGIIAAGGELTSLSDAVDNRGGLIQSGAALTLNSRGHALLNADSGDQGGIISDGSIKLITGDIDNHNGLIAAKSLTATSGAVNNQAGKWLTQQALSLNSGALNNQGGLLQSGGNLNLTTHNQPVDNHSGGQMIATGELAIHSGELDNRHGNILSGGDASLQTSSLNNNDGQLSAQGHLSLSGRSIQNNDGGLIRSAKDLLIDTHGALLSNQRSGDTGGIISQGNLSLNTGALENTQGTIISSRDMTLTTATVDNQQGLLASGEAMTVITGVAGNPPQGLPAGQASPELTLSSLDNRQGQIRSLGDMVLSVAQSVLDNSAGLIQGAVNVTLNALQVLNQNTREAGLGIRAETLTLKAGDLDNSNGQILTRDAMGLTLSNVLNNHAGLLSAQQSLSAQARQIINRDGEAEAGKQLTMTADTLTGDGHLLSLGDLTLNLTQTFMNTGTVEASGDLNLTTGGNLTNASLMRAGNALTLTANDIVNDAAAEINAGTTQLNAKQSLTNYGLIDGVYTRINGQTVSNTGSGRLYGDVLAIGAGTLNNLGQKGQAATLAARQRLDIGATTINNRDHSLIYSDGEMAIGGALNADGQATGQAAVLNNHSATIESAGDMTLNIAGINNINDHLTLEKVLVSQEAISEYEVSRLHNGVRYNDKDYTIYIYQDEVNTLCIEGVICNTTDGDRFTHFTYTRTITEDRIKESDPANILSGGNLSINAGQVLNDKSRIVAGGALALQGSTLNNVDAEGHREITDAGKAIFYYRHQQKHGDSSRVDVSDYLPPAIIQAITLKPGTVEEYTHGQGSGLNVTDHQGSEISGELRQADELTPLPGADSVNPGVPGAVPLPAGKTFEVTTESPGSVIRGVGPDTRLPDNSLFRTHPENNSPFLVETDPRFTDKKKWLGSDYMMDAFTRNPDNVLKRLGDGYYEQRLIREQILALTGQRYLQGAKNDEEQYKALMNEGIAFGQKYHLTPGVALSAEQMKLITGNMVWLVTQTVQLADGSTQQVLVPQVYARLQAGDLDGSGALLAGKNVSLTLSGDLNNSGQITAQQNTRMLAENIIQQGGLIQGNAVAVQARTDISNTGGLFSGNQTLSLLAGRDINALTTTRSAESAGGDFVRTTIDRVAGFSVQHPEGAMVLQAGRDVSLTAAQVSHPGDGGSTSIIAGRDISLNTVTTGSTDNLQWGENWLHQSASQQTGSKVAGGGDIRMDAGRNIDVTAGKLSAGQQLSLTAGDDISLRHGTDTETFDQHFKATGNRGLMSKTTTEVRDSFSNQTVGGSQLEGERISLSAGHDLTVTGSSVAGTQDVSLTAGNDLNILAAATEHQESHFYSEKKSGLSGTGGIGVSLGTRSLKTTDDGNTLSSTGSTVGSTRGSVTLTAGSGLTTQGSDVLAASDVNLTGKHVTLLAADHQSSQTHTTEQKQSGLTLALSGTVGSAINTAVSAASDAGTESSGRLAALQGMKAALSGVQAAQAVSLADATGSRPGSMAGVNLSYGRQSSTSTQTSTQNRSQGSTLTAGNNLTINATGTDINVQGSRLQAGKDMNLGAARDVNLFSALESQTLEGKNESHGTSVGVGIDAGQSGIGLSLNASVNKGKGSESGNGTRHNETVINAGNQLTLRSGRDTTLTGAQIGGEKVTLDAGRHLTLTSEQDTDNYDSKQQNASAGGSVSTNGPAISVNLSRDNMHSTYQSVQEQTGIFAGKGGFAATVGDHTQLNGAVIGSTADASRNSLDTGTLGFTDIKNSADYSVEHQSVGVSTGGSVGGQFAGNLANGLLTGVNSRGNDSSTTRSAVSEGTLTLRNKDHQTQDTEELSRDVAHASQTLSPIFDKEKEQNRLKEARLIGEIGNQAADIARTQGQIAGEKAKKDPAALQAAREQLAGQGNLSPTEKQIADQAFNTAMSSYGTGSALQQGIQAATAAVRGLAGGNIGQAVSGAASPYLAEQIHKLTDGNPQAQAIAHAVVGAVTSYAAGNNALAGAAGAVSGELMAKQVMAQLYPGKTTSELTETEKQTISALGTLAAGLAGGLTGNSTADAVSGAQTGKNAVENNFLGTTSSDKLDKAVEKIKNGDKTLATANELIKLENADKRSDALVDKFTRDPSQMSSAEQAELAGYLRVYAAEMEKEYGPAVSQELVKGLLSGQDYVKRNPDSEAMSKAQTIMNTWGYHKSNASIGDAPLMFGSSVLGTTIKEGMALNAAIGAGVNAGVQLTGNDPFSYVDVIMAGITSAATTGKGIGTSAAINMGGAAIGSGIKGEDPTNAVAGAGAGTVIGGVGGEVIKGATSKLGKDAISDLTGTIIGGYISEKTGNTVKETLDKKDDGNAKE